MDRVLVGAAIGAILGALLGSLASNLEANFQLNNPGGGGWQVVSLTKVVVALGIIFGAGSGGIIGAIAGAVSALPNARPLPAWFWWLVIGLLILAVFLGALMAFWAFRSSKPDPGPGQEHNAPITHPGKADQMPAPNPPPEQAPPRRVCQRLVPWRYRLVRSSLEAGPLEENGSCDIS